MTKKLKDLQAALEPKQTRLIEINKMVEDGSITDTEMAELRTLDGEIGIATSDIELLQRTSDRAAGKAKAAFLAKSPESKLAERVTISEMAKQLVKRSGPFEGAVAEMHEEGLKEARAAGISMDETAIAIPGWMHESRGVDAATAATAGNLIPTLQQPFTPALRPMSVLEKLGATFLRGLYGTLEFPAGDALTTSSYNTETGTSTESTPTTKKPTMTPKRQTTWSKSTLQLISQSSINVANWLESEILDAEMRKLNEVAIKGGATNEPTGILAMTLPSGHVLKIGPDANTGAVITRAHLLELEELLANAYANANEDTVKILTTNGVKRVLKNLPSATGIAPFVWENNNTVIGYNALPSTLVPKTLDIGTTTGVGHALIMGDFSKLLIGMWGVRYLTVDNLSRAKQGEIEIILNSFSDVQVIHKAGFVAIKDALLSV